MDILDLGHPRLSWGRLRRFAQAALADPGSALHRAQPGYDADAAAWSVTDRLLALVVHRLDILAWQKTKDGRSGRNAPQPIPVPGQGRGRSRKPAQLRDPDEARAILSAHARGSTEGG